MSNKNTAFAMSVKKFGGQVKFGDALGVSQQLVSYWINRGRLPASRVIEVERLFVDADISVDRYDLRPDVFGVRPESLKELG